MGIDILAYKAKAAAMWLAMDKSEQTGVRFGMFPAMAMQEAEALGYDGKELAVALMELANKSGGMVA